MITSADLKALMYDLPLLLTASRTRRGLSIYTAAAQAGVGPHTLQRIEWGKNCEVATLVRLLAWLENE